MINRIVIVIFCVLTTASIFAGDDILLADFENGYPEGWTTQGEAFGRAPNVGDMNNFRGMAAAVSNNKTKGTLVSAPIPISKKYLNFMIGGGIDKKATYLSFKVDGEEVSRVTGDRNRDFKWKSVDLSAHQGKTCTLELVDDSENAHHGVIGLDQVMLSDTPVEKFEPTREIILDKRYLQLPVCNSAAPVVFKIFDGDKLIHRFSIRYAFNNAPISFWGALDVTSLKGTKAKVSFDVDTIESEKKNYSLDKIVCEDVLRGNAPLYDEKTRPQLRFSQKRGWNNDPNGLVYHNGTWHMFWQHNPVGYEWGNMYWGHATSKDLLHWEEHENALRPFVDAKAMCWSGGGAVDHSNSSGLKTGKEDPIVIFFADTGAGESIAFSNDRGKSFTPYKNNPVLRHHGHDAKAFWYEPGKHWVLVTYEVVKGKKAAAFYSSKDLIKWERQGHVLDFFECPELFPLAIDGGKETKWVVYGANGLYMIGDFDGKNFTPLSDEKFKLYNGCFYAAQNFNNVPDGRTIQMGWNHGIGMPQSEPFNQSFTLPMELSLKTTAKGPRMFAVPISEMKQLRGEAVPIKLDELNAGKPVDLKGHQLWDLELDFEISEDGWLRVRMDDMAYTYKPKELKDGIFLERAKTKVRRVRIITDRPLYEVFVNDGQQYYAVSRRNDMGKPLQNLRVESKDCRIVGCRLYPMKSIWKSNKDAKQ